MMMRILMVASESTVNIHSHVQVRSTVQERSEVGLIFDGRKILQVPDKLERVTIRKV